MTHLGTMTLLQIYLRSDPSVLYESKAFSILALSNARAMLRSKNDSIGMLHVHTYKLPVPMLEEDSDLDDVYARIHELYGGIPSQKQAHQITYGANQTKKHVYIVSQQVEIKFTDEKKSWSRAIAANTLISVLKKSLKKKKQLAESSHLRLYIDDGKKMTELHDNTFLFEYLQPHDLTLHIRVSVPKDTPSPMSWNMFRKVHAGKPISEIRKLYWAQPGKQ